MSFRAPTSYAGLNLAIHLVTSAQCTSGQVYSPFPGPAGPVCIYRACRACICLCIAVQARIPLIQGYTGLHRCMPISPYIQAYTRPVYTGICLCTPIYRCRACIHDIQALHRYMPTYRYTPYVHRIYRPMHSLYIRYIALYTACTANIGYIQP